MGGAPAETTRGSRDRLKGQPQERQHSAVEGGTRDRLPPASDSRATSRLVGINFAFMILSQCCARRFTVCACSLSQFFLQRTTWPRKRRRQRRPRRQPPRRWQRRPQRKRSSRIRDREIAACGSQPGRKAKPLQRISNVLCSRSVSRQGIIRPDLCAAGYCTKVRFFVSAPARGMICSCAKDRCRMAATLLRRGSREPGSRNADAQVIPINLKPRSPLSAPARSEYQLLVLA